MIAATPRALRKYLRARLTAEALIAAIGSDGGPSPAFIYRAGMDVAGMGGTATRASVALYRDSAGIWQSAATATLRDAHYHYTGTASVRTTLREGAGTNSALGACSFADGTYWAGNASFTLAAATSCISGQTAYKHTDAAGGAYRSQSVGVFVNAQVDCASAILENTDTATSLVGIRDATAAAWLNLVSFNWTTKAVTSISSFGVHTEGVIDLGDGRYRVWCTSTGTAAGTGGAGNTRAHYIAPAVTAGKAAIIHHAQFEAATSVPSSPIVTVAAAVTRAADLWSFAWSRNPEAGTWYVDAYILNTALAGVNYPFVFVGDTAAAAEARFQLRLTGSTMVGAALHHNGTVQVTSSTANAAAFGNRCELRGSLDSTGAVQAGLAINAGAETVGAASAANTFTVAWDAPARLWIGQLGSAAGDPTNLAIRSIAYVPQANYPRDSFRQMVG